MSDQNQQLVPPLDCDLATIDVSMPLLADGVYDVQIAKAEMKSTAAGGRMIHLDLVTTEPGQARNGSVLGAGVHVFNNVNAAPSGKATWDMVKQNLGALVQAAQLPPGTAGLANIDAWVPTLVGKVVRVKVGYRAAGVGKNGKSFKEQNEVLYFTKKV